LLLEAPDVLYGLHKAYLEAGANVIYTDTYQISRHTVEQARLEGITTVKDLFMRGIRLVQDVVCTVKQREDRPVVAISLGSWGAMLGGGKEYSGEYGDVEDLLAFYMEQVEIAVECAAACGLMQNEYVLGFETLPSSADMRAVAQALMQVAPQVYACVSMYCTPHRTTGDGKDIAETAAMLVDAMSGGRLAMLSVNCARPRVCADNLSLIQAKLGTAKFLYGCYPNGREWDTDGWVAVDDDEADLQQWVEQVTALPVQVFGGCCMTTPRHIAQLVKQLATVH
jgi:homocysteine S-methyltransferase